MFCLHNVFFCTLPDEAEAKLIVTVHRQFSNENNMGIIILGNVLGKSYSTLYNTH